MSPYEEALQWIERNPGTGGASSLAKLLLSLWNQDCSYSYRECVSNLDDDLTALSVRIIAHFAKGGEDADLRAVGEKVYRLYPRMWDAGQAMQDARNALRRQWDAEAQRERDRLYPDD